ncbi:hypothetical protein C0Q70_04785 [Pomacea canaliculata]|uniref:Uncharacterized protein n=1 Tax=Pomacea canaliculata TaxID=400727 RepID=A0A2T7PJC9_POMCA|nr:hypothetical protein C0Q70_04785 [Pomacea canaliculata]
MLAPSAKKIRDVIHMEKTSSKGDTLIFHNLPLLCDETLERQVVNFCQNFLVVGIRKLHISDVHRMEPRFGNDGPITVHLSAAFKFVTVRIFRNNDVDEFEVMQCQAASVTEYESQLLSEVNSQHADVG